MSVLSRLLTRLLPLPLAAVATCLLPAAPAAAAGDDYPYRADSSGTADRWGFTKRQCTSFTAWRMQQRGNRLDNGTQRWGSALTWDETARRLGHRIGSRPVVGAVAHWNAGERSSYYAPGSSTPGTMTAGSSGHVAYVRGVHSDGSVSVEHYNLRGERRYGVSRVRAPRYLYVGVQPR